MRWQTALQAVLDAMVADSALAAVVGSSIFFAGERDSEIPSIECFPIVRSELEIEESFLVQFSLSARTMDDLNTMETRTRAVVHYDTWRTLGGIYLRATFEGAEEYPTADGVLGRSLDFRVETVRDQWA